MRPFMFAGFALALAATPALAADGAELFALQCEGCHAAASTPVAPTLKGVAGGKIASATGFTYSAGLKAKTGTWTDANLDAFLAAPAKFAPGTKMMTAGVEPEDRAALIGYLKTLK